MSRLVPRHLIWNSLTKTPNNRYRFPQLVIKPSQVRHFRKKPPPPRSRLSRWSEEAALWIFTLGGAYWVFAVYDDKYGPPGSQKSSFEIASRSPYVLKSKEPVSSTSSIFTLESSAKKPFPETDYSSLWSKGIWSVRIKQPQLQIARSYTPLPPALSNDGDAKGSSPLNLRILIRREPSGEMSGYLHRLPVGAPIEIISKEPEEEFHLTPDIDEVLFIAGGTGIAPALQAAFTLSRSGRADSPPPRMHILWANRGPEDCQGGENSTVKPSYGWFASLFSVRDSEATRMRRTTRASENAPRSQIVEELEGLKARLHGRLKVDYFVDAEKSFIGPDTLSRVLTEKNHPHHPPPPPPPPQQQHSSAGNGTRRNKLILVSGPEGFVNYIAGPKYWKDGKETQGPLAGLLLKTASAAEGWDVWKL